MKSFTFIWMLLLTLFSSSAIANSDVAFAYQGRVRVQGSPFEGEGQFKFAIVSTSGDTVLWTHDGTGYESGVPSGHLTLPVEEGIFNVIIGDTNAGMIAINSTIFNSPTPLKLRVWFSNGALGFQQLNPDYNLVNLALNTLQSSVSDFTIYVNGQNGNDSNNGLTPGRAKKTIQAAVDTLPERIQCNITIDIADGTYLESVKVFGLSVDPEKSLLLIGDEDWNGTGEPSVRISGSPDGNTNQRSRNYGIVARQTSGIAIQGISFDNFATAGIQLDNGLFDIANCRVTSSTLGVCITDSTTTSTNIHVSDCTEDGIRLISQGYGIIRNCSSVKNGGNGLRVNAGSAANLQGSGNYSNNGECGYKVHHQSHIVFNGVPGTAYTGIVANNGSYGFSVRYQSFSENFGPTNTFINNGAAAVHQSNGGAAY